MSDSHSMPVGTGFDAHVGTEFIETTPERALARIPVTERVLQPLGLVHGGVYSALAESICSATTALAVRKDGQTAVGIANHASFMRPITAGHINAEARRRHRGRTTWVWEVDITDDAGRLCAIVRVTLAIRDRG